MRQLFFFTQERQDESHPNARSDIHHFRHIPRKGKDHVRQRRCEMRVERFEEGMVGLRVAQCAFAFPFLREALGGFVPSLDQ